MTDRGDSLYVWQVFDTDEQWGIIGSYSETGPVPLVTRNFRIAQSMMRDIAVVHHEHSGRPVRLVRFGVSKVLEQW